MGISLQHRRDRGTINFYQRMGLQCRFNRRQVPIEQFTQVAHGDISCFHQQQFPGTPLQQMRVEKITVFGNDNSFFGKGDLIDDAIFGRVLIGQLESINSIVSLLIQERTESWRQMCINEEFHARARCVLRVASMRRENS